MTATPFLGLHPRTKPNRGKGPHPPNQTRLDSAIHQATPLTAVSLTLSRSPKQAHFRARFAQHLSSQIQAPLRDHVLGECRPKPALKPWPPESHPHPLTSLV